MGVSASSSVFYSDTVGGDSRRYFGRAGYADAQLLSSAWARYSTSSAAAASRSGGYWYVREMRLTFRRKPAARRSRCYEGFYLIHF